MAATNQREELAPQIKDVVESVEESESESKSSNCVLRLIQHHYGDTKCIKSEAQIAREANLVPGVPFNRWFLIPAAIVIQFCCGSLYAWSVFNQPIDKLIYGEVINMAPITFYIAVGCFGTSAAITGPILERKGAQITCIIGTCLFVMGNYLSALALYLHQIWLLFLGYGIISGIGLGICYISPVSALQKWFPDKRGLASGLAVSGFGGGSILMAKVQLPLLHSVGLPWTFVILGSIYLTLMTLSALVLRTPPPNFSIASAQHSVRRISEDYDMENSKLKEAKNESELEQISLIHALTSNNYRCMYAMMFANSIFGLVVISRLANMTKDVFGRSEEEGSTIVSINGLFNLGGRLCFSILSDYIGRKNCFFIMLTTQLIILGSFYFITTTQTYWAFLLTIWLITACYAAGFAVIPAYLSDSFGSQNIGACHGVILTAWSIAGVGGGLMFTFIFNYIRNSEDVADPYPYNVNIWWMLAIVCIGWIALLFVSPTKKDKEFVSKLRDRTTSIFSRNANRQRTFEMNRCT